MICGTKTAQQTKTTEEKKTLRVLLVGEKEEDYFLIRDLLRTSQPGIDAKLEHATSVEQAKRMLSQQSYGLILFHHDSADDTAVRQLQEQFDRGLCIPFILLTEMADEAAVARILEAGAWDCIERTELNGATFGRTVRCTTALQAMRDSKQSAEESLRKLSQAVEQSDDSVVITDLQGVIEYVNPAFERLTGYSSAEVHGKTPRILKSGQHAPEFYEELWHTILAGKVFRRIVVNRKKNGNTYYTEESISPVRDSGGEITHFISNGRDLTERLRLEAQLVQAQKMDAVGRLAGGVAHDFNNLLTIIISYSELAMDSVVPNSPLAAKLSEILSAGKRAAELTRQLLAFSRKQPQTPRFIDLNRVVREMTGTLQRLMGEDIQLSFAPRDGLSRVRLDPVQLEQILMNLAANARDAMPQGGSLRIETSEVCIGEAYIQKKPAVIPKGRYVLLVISDNGNGIPQDQLPHIFEPFFTTKPSGQGTGLGLATVYGIVKQNGGYIWVYSEPQMGTVFKIYFPCAGPTNATGPQPRVPSAIPQRGSETILLVEDEAAVRQATAEYLGMQGYKIIEAKDGVEARTIAVKFDAQIHLVISDVVMPNMSGGELVQELKSILPNTKVLFVSGYPGKTVQDHNVVDFGSNFLQKPFTLRQLSDKVREVIDQPVPHRE